MFNFSSDQGLSAEKSNHKSFSSDKLVHTVNPVFVRLSSRKHVKIKMNFKELKIDFFNRMAEKRKDLDVLHGQDSVGLEIMC